jgi:AhpD family alkylhydroperoxidase
LYCGLFDGRRKSPDCVPVAVWTFLSEVQWVVGRVFQPMILPPRRGMPVLNALSNGPRRSAPRSIQRHTSMSELKGVVTMSHRLEQFRRFRERMNQRILDQKSQQVNRFFGLDTKAYQDGALDARTKEIAGLAASMVLRCDDCVSYHIIRCKELGVRDEELWEVFNIGLIVGGSIVIPHLRRAVELLDEINGEQPAPGSEE